ncbi:hypothetical protein FRB94_008515 [Tulasnella sp. JGI-2019a]|nr:hypothetical protein FRB94_008515 [Tulasnella sp. JGI-2019a]KAG8999380.1 hypothetical protein FRB93_013259 [Tulasnella sp. JGI-2019a]
MFAETTRKGQTNAIAIIKDAVVSGTYDSPAVQDQQQMTGQYGLWSWFGEWRCVRRVETRT